MLPNVTVGRPRAVISSASTAAGQISRTQEEEAFGEGEASYRGKATSFIDSGHQWLLCWDLACSLTES